MLKVIFFTKSAVESKSTTCVKIIPPTLPEPLVLSTFLYTVQYEKDWTFKSLDPGLSILTNWL
jgi:hypothetical protein